MNKTSNQTTKFKILAKPIVFFVLTILSSILLNTDTSFADTTMKGVGDKWLKMNAYNCIMYHSQVYARDNSNSNILKDIFNPGRNYQMNMLSLGLMGFSQASCEHIANGDDKNFTENKYRGVYQKYANTQYGNTKSSELLGLLGYERVGSGSEKIRIDRKGTINTTGINQAGNTYCATGICEDHKPFDYGRAVTITVTQYADGVYTWIFENQYDSKIKCSLYKGHIVCNPEYGDPIQPKIGKKDFAVVKDAAKTSGKSGFVQLVKQFNPDSTLTEANLVENKDYKGKSVGSEIIAGITDKRTTSELYFKYYGDGIGASWVTPGKVPIGVTRSTQRPKDPADGKTDLMKAAIFTAPEEYLLYSTYIRDPLAEDVDKAILCDGKGGKEDYSYKVKEGSRVKDCYILNKYVNFDTTAKSYHVQTYDAGKGTLYDELVSFETVLKRNNELFENENKKAAILSDGTAPNAEDIKKGTLDTESGKAPADDNASDSTKPDRTCYTNAGAVGWIVCPIIENLSTFILEKYTEYLEPALKIDPVLFSTNGNGSNTFESWKQFRDIANLLFIIFGLFVIFSQLTGIGIDNYGIKKSLPRLVVAAIMINMSFIICQLCIDVSNICGRGLGDFLQSTLAPVITVDDITANKEIAEAFKASESSSDFVAAIKNIGQGFGDFSGQGWKSFAIVLLVGVLTAGPILAQGMAFIIPVLCLVVSVAFTVLVTVALLGLRQAMAVILVIISPIAIACYMLPNTKKLFDQWFKAYKALLLAYPICSALIYGGDAVAKLLLHSGSSSTWVMLSAAAISVAPALFIPKVIQDSMGAIGQMVANWGSKGAKATSAGLSASAFAKGLQDKHNSRKQFNRALRKGHMKIGKDGKAVTTRYGQWQDKMYDNGPKFLRGLTANQRARHDTRVDRQKQEALAALSGAANAGRYQGEIGRSKITNAVSASVKKNEQEDVQNELLNMQEEFGNLNKGTLRRELTKLAEKGEPLTEREKLRAKAMASKLGESAIGASAVADIMRQGGDTAKAISDYAVNNDSKLYKALKDSDPYAAEYASDLARGKYSGNYENWADQQIVKTDDKGEAILKNGKPVTMTKTETLSNGIDRNDLSSMSEKAIKTWTGDRKNDEAAKTEAQQAIANAQDPAAQRALINFKYGDNTIEASDSVRTIKTKDKDGNLVDAKIIVDKDGNRKNKTPIFDSNWAEIK